MTLIDEDDRIVLHEFESHGIKFEINVEPSIWGMRNKPIFFNHDFTFEGVERRMRNQFKFSECRACGNFQNDRSKDGCFKRPRVEIIV